MLVVSMKTRHGFRQQPPWADRARFMARRRFAHRAHTFVEETGPCCS
jgi:hypothetical protein